MNRAYMENVGITVTILSLPFSIILGVLLAAIRPGLIEAHALHVYIRRGVAAVGIFIAAAML